MLKVNNFNTTDAEEWLTDLQDSFGFSLLQNTIEIAIIVGESEDPLEAVICYNALAAIEVISALQGQASPHLPNKISTWVSEHQRLTLPHNIEQQAKKALILIRQESELQTLWQNTPHFTHWLAQLDELEQRIDYCIQLRL